MKTTVIKQLKNDKGQIVRADKIRTIPASRLIADLEKQITQVNFLIQDGYPETLKDFAEVARDTLRCVIRMIKSY